MLPIPFSRIFEYNEAVRSFHFWVSNFFLTVVLPCGCGIQPAASLHVLRATVSWEDFCVAGLCSEWQHRGGTAGTSEPDIFAKRSETQSFNCTADATPTMWNLLLVRWLEMNVAQEEEVDHPEINRMRITC